MIVQTELEFSRPVALTNLAGGEIRIMAGTDERVELARRLGLVALDSLHATVCLEPEENGGIVRLRGTLRADVTQACVVLLSRCAHLLRLCSSAGMPGRKVKDCRSPRTFHPTERNRPSRWSAIPSTWARPSPNNWPLR
jgi:hypothetical protein